VSVVIDLDKKIEIDWI